MSADGRPAFLLSSGSSRRCNNRIVLAEMDNTRPAPSLSTIIYHDRCLLSWRPPRPSARSPCPRVRLDRRPSRHPRGGEPLARQPAPLQQLHHVLAPYAEHAGGLCRVNDLVEVELTRMRPLRAGCNPKFVAVIPRIRARVSHPQPLRPEGFLHLLPGEVKRSDTPCRQPKRTVPECDAQPTDRITNRVARAQRAARSTPRACGASRRPTEPAPGRAPP